MDFSYTPEEEAFRQELRDWLSEAVKELPEWQRRRDVPGPEVDSDESNQFAIWWHKKLNEAGYVGLTWPKEYGGGGRTPMEQVIFYEEIARHHVPGPANGHGIGWVGPALLRHGTEEQRRRFIPKILSAAEIWCTFYSEPGSGSDMAAAQTRAVEEGDEFVINGQKVWSSGAHQADWAVMLARTDPEARKHRGLSYLMLDMKTPGITIRPLRNITGSHEFNEAFFDNVRIPKHQIIGEKNMGWYVAAGALEFERSSTGAAVTRENTIRDIIRLTKELDKNRDPIVRQKLAQLYVDATISRYLSLTALTNEIKQGQPGPAGAVGSLFGVEFNQRMHDFVMQLEGPYSRLLRDSPHTIDFGRWQYQFLRSRANTIETGTAEIKRNIIAQRVLGLPR